MLTHIAVYTQIAFFILFQNDFSVLSYVDLLAQNASTHSTPNDSTTTSSLLEPEAYPLPKPEPLITPLDSASGLPVFPERTDAVYFVVAVVGGGKLWGRTLAKTLLDLGPPFTNPQGPPLRPVYVDMPQNGR